MYKYHAICLIGPPASGKGTTALKIKEEFGYELVMPGYIYKALREQDTEMGRLVKDSLAGGGLCPSWLTNKIMLEEGEKIAKATGKPFIYDGYPRTVDQQEFMTEHFEMDLYLHFDSDINTIRKMAVNRRNCASCKCVFSATGRSWVTCGNVQELPENCAVHNEGAWEQRWDDTEELFDKRYLTYKKETEPIIAMIQHLPNYLKVDVMNDKGAIERILDIMRGSLKPAANSDIKYQNIN